MGEREKSSPCPVRACLFDMDGLLLNTEDIYTLCANNVLAKYNRPPLPWSIKARLMGVPGSSNGDVFHAWAQLPISRDQFKAEQGAEQLLHFAECAPLPGTEKLLADLTTLARSGGESGSEFPVQVALATSSEKRNFDIKTSRPMAKALLDHIPTQHRVLGDDPRIRKGRGKPAPEIYLLALETVNEHLPAGVPRIAREECLVFEDSVPGVEAGRRAGMQVVWVPHPGLAEEFKGKEKEVLAGRTGLIDIGDEHQLGSIDDDWARQLASLENFPYAEFGITGVP